MFDFLSEIFSGIMNGIFVLLIQFWNDNLKQRQDSTEVVEHHDQKDAA